jgi:hypothetical protein
MIKYLLLLSLLTTLSHAAVSPALGIYYQKGAKDCWYLSAKGKDLQGAAGWGRFLMEPAGPGAYKVKSWPDSEFKFEAPGSFAEYKSGKLFKEFTLDPEGSAALLSPGSALSPASAAGIWKGQFKAAFIYKIDIFIHLEAGSDGSYSAKMDIPKSQLLGQKLAWAELQGGVLSLDFFGGLYLGRLNADGTKSLGSIYGDGKPYPLELQRVEKGPEPKT